MKKIIFYAIAFITLAIAGCNKNELNPIQENIHTVKASINDFGTKTSMYGNTVNWEEGDQITRFTNDGRQATYTLSAGAGTNEGIFSTNEDVEGMTFVAALYPADTDATYSDGTIHTSFGKKYQWQLNHNNKAAMASLGSTPDHISFRNAGAVIALTVNNIPAGYDRIILSSGIQVNGDAEITFSDKGEPSCRIVSNGEENKTTTISFTKSVASSDKIFYFPIGVTSTNTSVNISLSDGNYTQTIVDNKAMINAIRNTRYYRTINFDSKGELPVELSGKDNIDDKISEGVTNFILPSECTELVIESATNDEIQLAVTTSGNVFTLSAEGLEGKIDLCTPKYLSNLNINVPNGTVEIKPDVTVATFNTITASTSENTLIIPVGVTVNNLIVKNGNVRVFGKVLNISNEKASGKVVVYKEEGGEVPAGLDANKFELIDYNAENSGYVLTKEQLFDAVANATDGDVISLGKDLQLTETLVIGKSITLDGGNHTIVSSATRGINISGAGIDVTIKNLKIVASGERAINVIQNTKKVTIDNVDASSANYAVNVAGSAPNTTIEINNSYFTGLNTINVAGANSIVTINDSHLLCNDMNDYEGYGAISIHQDGSGTNVLMNGGSVTVKGKSYGGVLMDGYANITFNGTKGNTEIYGINYIIEYGDVYYYGMKNLESAIEIVKAGETIKLVNDVTITKAVEIKSGKSFTLDLNGKTITLDVEDGATTVTDINNYGNITIMNGTISAASKELSRRCIYNKAGGTMNIEKMKFIQTYHPKGAAINNEGIMTISDTEVDAIYYAIWMSGKNAVTTVNSGTFKTKNNVNDRSTWAYTVSVLSGSQLIVNNGSFTGNHGVISATDGSKATLYKGTYTCTAEYTGNSDWALYASGTGSVINYDAQNCNITNANTAGISITENGGTINNTIPNEE